MTSSIIRKVRTEKSSEALHHMAFGTPCLAGKNLFALVRVPRKRCCHTLALQEPQVLHCVGYRRGTEGSERRHASLRNPCPQNLGQFVVRFPHYFRSSCDVRPALA